MKHVRFAAAALFIGVILFAPPAEAGIVKGIQEIVAGVLQVPLSTIAGTFGGPPIAGTLFGAASGLFNGVGLVASGVLNVAFGALGIAKTVAPFVLPFVL